MNHPGEPRFFAKLHCAADVLNASRRCGLQRRKLELTKTSSTFREALLYEFQGESDGRRRAGMVAYSSGKAQPASLAPTESSSPSRGRK